MNTYVTKSEVHDLTSEGGFGCQNWGDLNSYGATGGLLGSTPLICGGIADEITSDVCYTLDKDKATNTTKLSVKRAHSTSTILDSNHLWISGGMDEEAGLIHSSSEIVNIESTYPGPELPRPLFMHAMVSLEGNLTMVIGGANSISKSTTDSESGSNMTYIYNHMLKNWTNGPTMNMARASHAAFIVTDLVTDERLVIAAGGHQISTEILIENVWIQGNNLR